MSLAPLIRTGAFVRKEIAEVARQPRLLIVLVLAPFLILLLFGAGLRDSDPPVRTLFVTPQDGEFEEELEQFAREQSGRLTVVGVVRDQDRALDRLDRGDVELVVVFPEEAIEEVRQDRRAMITTYHSQIDPLESQAVLLYTDYAVNEVNRRVLSSVVADSQGDTESVLARVSAARERVGVVREARARDDEGEARIETRRLGDDARTIGVLAAPVLAVAGGVGPGNAQERDPGTALERLAARGEELEGGDEVSDDELVELESDLEILEEALEEFGDTHPEVLAAPFAGEVVRLVEGDVQMSDFYAPAVLVVLLQHLLITFLALSLVREDELGATEVYRIAPLRAGEALAGKLVAHTLLALIGAAVLLSLLIGLLGVPMRGSWFALAGTLVALVLASAAVGVLVAGAARSDSQAVQYTMMVLLATIFFSGFLLSLDRFLPWLQPAGWILPATYGIELARDVLLRGQVDLGLLGALVAYTVVLVGAAWWMMRHRFRRSVGGP